MNTTERLAFRLTIAEPNTTERTITVCPRYDGLKLKWSRPSGQMYYTEDISGTLKFLGVDFQTLNACALNTQFTLIVYQNRVEVGRSLFRKTDCKWDIDHGVVDVDISVYDEYKKFQDKKDEEYNLVKIEGMTKHSINMYKYPIIQTYIKGDSKVANFGFTTGDGRAVDSGICTDMSDMQKMFFFRPSGGYGYKMAIGFYASTGTYAGRYSTITDHFQDDNFPTLFADGGGNYMITLSYINDYSGTHWWFEMRQAGSGIVARYPQGGTSYINSFDDLLSMHNITFGNTTFTCRFWIAGCRLLTDVPLSGTNEGKLGEDVDDIASQSFRYGKHVESNDILVCSRRVSATDKGYGRIENSDEYYDTPDDTYKYVPLNMESWAQGCSIWARERLITTAEKNTYKRQYLVPDFYLLTDAIRAVAQKIDEDIQFDSLDSQFLFNSLNPLNGIQQGALYISQKSNILNLGYDYPAWLAPVKWSQIETLLREAFDCYWSLYVRDGHKHLQIEHRRWYELGGTYTQSAVQVASIDLTATFRNGTSFTFGEKTRHWEFDTDGNGTVSTASRHEYGWMDTQSEIFDGQPITVPEAYRLFTDEKVEQHKVDWFSSDIDFLTSVQAECSSDGFALVMENPNQSNWIITGATEYSGQNYQLSFDYLQKKYLLQGIYAEYIKIGDNATLTATDGNARMRTSEIQLRVPAGMSIEASDTIKTHVGIGVIDTLEYDLHSELYTAKLRYENE